MQLNATHRFAVPRLAMERARERLNIEASLPVCGRQFPMGDDIKN
jgi:hypothetical protein